MAEITQTPPHKKRRGLRGMLQNPVTKKELRSRMRGRRAYVTLTVYLLLMSALITLIYTMYVQETRSYGVEARSAGIVVFATVVGVQVFLAAFIGPAFTASTISGEKERQTYDLLRTTLLPARSLVAGKLISALSYVLLLVAASFPLHGIGLLLGGVSMLEFVISQVLIVVAAVTFALWGMYVSSFMRTTMASSVVTYAGTLFMIIGLPFLAMITLPFIGDIIFNNPDTPAEIALLMASFILASTNIVFTLGISDGFYRFEDSLWFFEETFGKYTVYLPSPWWVFIIFYTLFSLFLFWRCVRVVQRIPNR